LTDPNEYEGGDFEILDEVPGEKLKRTRGTLLAFPSYTLHAVTPVTKGTRNSLVSWISGKPFR
jgi:PKHD-type hydroxylase